MKGLIEQGSRVAFSLRAQGNVHRDAQLNATIVEAPIQIATYDWVVNPSHDKAFLESICEATKLGFFGAGTQQMSLTESVHLFEEGNLIDISENVQSEVIDYASTYSKKIKKLNEAYLYDPADKLTVDGDFGLLENGTTRKKVVLEDYLLKDLRHKIRTIGKEDINEAKFDGHGKGKQLEKGSGDGTGPDPECDKKDKDKKDKEDDAKSEDKK